MLLPLQFLAVAGAAVFVGVMLAIALVLGTFWRALPPAEFLAWFADNSGVIARTILVVVVPALIGLVGSLALSWGNASARNLWLAALGCIIALLVLTATYFLPMNATFDAGTVALSDVPGRIDAWLAMHWARIALALAATGFGFVAATR